MTFLDEPTTGLDPRARRALWDVIRDINRRGTTVVLTTHYMEEAERLCDRVAVMDRGRIMALDTPRALINRLGGEAHVMFALSDRVELGRLCGLDGVASCSAEDDEGYTLVAADAQRAVVALLDFAAEGGIEVTNLDVKGANLEDVFLAMTGRKLEEGDDETGASGEQARPAKRRRAFLRRGAR